MLVIIKKKRMLIVIILILIILLFYIFFVKNNYKNLNSGNNMTNKSIEEVEKYILDIGSYEAQVSVTVESNKNINKYILKQKYIKPNKFKQVVLEPSSIEGLEIVYDGENLNVNNTKLNLSKVYKNYKYLTNNFLCLESFVSEYKTEKEKSKTKLYEKDNEVVLEINTETNKYISNKKLYIDKKTGKPTKLLIEDVNEKTLIYILYTEIKINDLNNDVLALKIMEPYARLY